MQTSASTSSGLAAHDPSISIEAALGALRDQAGRTLREICEDRPTLVCLLRHNGCTFCRETIAALGRQHDAITEAGLNIAVVGMVESAASLMELGRQFGLGKVAWVADPERRLYRALSIGRGRVMQLLGPSVVWAGIRAALRGFGFGKPGGDPLQMPGTAVIHRGRVVRQYVHRTAADRPDYAALACERPA